MTTMDYLQIDGVVSNTCQAYRGSASKCMYECDDGQKSYHKYYCELGSLNVATTVDEIKEELQSSGPMMMGLRIYEDFLNYASGVYKYTTGELVGGHAMKVVGWGEDEKEGLYWVLQNQWTTDWGEFGFIKIKHGEVGIDSIALGCMPDLLQAEKDGLL